MSNRAYAENDYVRAEDELTTREAAVVQHYARKKKEKNAAKPPSAMENNLSILRRRPPVELPMPASMSGPPADIVIAQRTIAVVLIFIFLVLFAIMLFDPAD